MDDTATNLAYDNWRQQINLLIGPQQEENKRTITTRKRSTSLSDFPPVIKVDRRESMAIVHSAIQTKNRYSIFALLMNKILQNLAINTNLPAKKSQMPNLHQCVFTENRSSLTPWYNHTNTLSLQKVSIPSLLSRLKVHSTLGIANKSIRSKKKYLLAV